LFIRFAQERFLFLIMLPSFCLDAKRSKKIKAYRKFLEIYAGFRPRDPSRAGDEQRLLPALADRLLRAPSLARWSAPSLQKPA
jgi:hypothetical protein